MDGMTMDMTSVSEGKQFKCLEVIVEGKPLVPSSTIHDLNMDGNVLWNGKNGTAYKEIEKKSENDEKSKEKGRKNEIEKRKFCELPKSHLLDETIKADFESEGKEYEEVITKETSRGNIKANKNNNNIQGAVTGFISSGIFVGKIKQVSPQEEYSTDSPTGGGGEKIQEGSFPGKEVYGEKEDDLTQGIQVERSYYDEEEEYNNVNKKMEQAGKEVTRISTLVSRTSLQEAEDYQMARGGKEEQRDGEDWRRNQSGDEEEREKGENDTRIMDEEGEDEDEEEEEERIWREESESRCGSRFVRRSITSIELDQEEGEEGKCSFLSPLSSTQLTGRTTVDKVGGIEDGDWYVKGEDGEWMKESEWEEKECERRESQDLIPGLPPFTSVQYHEYERTLSSDSWTSSTTTSSSFDSDEEKDPLHSYSKRARKSSILTQEKKREREERRMKERRRSRSISWGTAETVEFVPFPREVMETASEAKVSNGLGSSYIKLKEPSNALFLSLGFFFTGSLICYRFYLSHFDLFFGGQKSSDSSYTYQF